MLAWKKGRKMFNNTLTISMCVCVRLLLSIGQGY